MDLQTAIAKLELTRLMAYQRKIKRAQEMVDKQIQEVNQQLNEHKKVLNQLKLVEQLEELVELSEKYRQTLERVGSSKQEAQDHEIIIRNIGEHARDREAKSHEAVELICNLLDSAKSRKNVATNGHQ